MEEKKYPIKWEYKNHSYQIGDTGDYDGYWEVTNGKDSLITKEDYDEIEKDLQAVVDLLNNTYANFAFNRDVEAALEAENKWLRCELEELKKQPDAAWIKASERLPGYETPVRWRDGKDHYYATKGEISLSQMDKPNLEGWEWYESGATPSGEIEVADKHGFRETIEDIIFSAGKHNQEQCSVIADVILRDLLIVSRYQSKDESPAAGREEDAVSFADWANDNYLKCGDEMKWTPQFGNRRESFTTGQLYELFKQQKEKQ